MELYPPIYSSTRERDAYRQGAEWADENPDERMIAKYLYEKKGYPIDLNGNLPSFEETMKDVEKYNKYKEDKLIDRAAEWLKEKFWYLADLAELTEKLKKTMKE